MKAGEFGYLFDDKTKNKVVETVTNDAEGNISTLLNWHLTSWYLQLPIVEKRVPTCWRYSYCNSSCWWGKLMLLAYENDDKTFENIRSRRLQLLLKWQKVLTGRTLKADEFEFILKNDADGSEFQKWRTLLMTQWHSLQSNTPLVLTNTLSLKRAGKLLTV